MTTPPVPLARVRLPISPDDVPGLVSFWDFQQRRTDGQWPAAQGTHPCPLTEQAGPLDTVTDPHAPFHGRALHLPEGHWLAIPRADCPALDFHGPTGHFTVIAWIKRARTAINHCEFIAGQWNETDRTRQYGLFLNIHMWNTQDAVCGHLSTHGGPTPGYRYCTDGPMGATPVPIDQWACVAMSYDGQHGYAWLDGVLDEQPRINPYLIPGGLNDGGPNGSDFTVGAVNRSGKIGNFFTGLLGGLAVYNRVLTPAEMYALGYPLPPQ